MRDTNWSEVVRIIRECEDYKGHGESRYHEEQKELWAYNKIKELVGDEKDKGEGYQHLQ